MGVSGTIDLRLQPTRLKIQVDVRSRPRWLEIAFVFVEMVREGIKRAIGHVFFLLWGGKAQDGLHKAPRQAEPRKRRPKWEEPLVRTGAVDPQPINPSSSGVPLGVGKGNHHFWRELPN